MTQSTPRTCLTLFAGLLLAACSKEPVENGGVAKLELSVTPASVSAVSGTETSPVTLESRFGFDSLAEEAQFEMSHTFFSSNEKVATLGKLVPGVGYGGPTIEGTAIAYVPERLSKAELTVKCHTAGDATIEIRGQLDIREAGDQLGAVKTASHSAKDTTTLAVKCTTPTTVGAGGAGGAGGASTSVGVGGGGGDLGYSIVEGQSVTALGDNCFEHTDAQPTTLLFDAPHSSPVTLHATCELLDDPKDALASFGRIMAHADPNDHFASVSCFVERFPNGTGEVGLLNSGTFVEFAPFTPVANASSMADITCHFDASTTSANTTGTLADGQAVNLTSSAFTFFDGDRVALRFFRSTCCVDPW